MRVSKSDLQVIKETIFEFASSFDLYLHGSRIDDSLTGGDLDLFLILPDQIFQNLQLKKHYLESKLSLKLREQKVDLITLSQSQSLQDSFFINSHKIKI